MKKKLIKSNPLTLIPFSISFWDQNILGVFHFKVQYLFSQKKTQKRNRTEKVLFSNKQKTFVVFATKYNTIIKCIIECLGEGGGLLHFIWFDFVKKNICFYLQSTKIAFVLKNSYVTWKILVCVCALKWNKCFYETETFWSTNF